MSTNSHSRFPPRPAYCITRFMVDALNTYYDWLRAAHIIAVISWMAGMLYLPRLFVYHVDAPKGSALSETFKLMERRFAQDHHEPGDDSYLDFWRAYARRGAGTCLWPATGCMRSCSLYAS